MKIDKLPFSHRHSSSRNVIVILHHRISCRNVHFFAVLIDLLMIIGLKLSSRFSPSHSQKLHGLINVIQDDKSNEFI